MRRRLTFVAPRGGFQLPGQQHQIFDELRRIGLDFVLERDGSLEPSRDGGWLMFRGSAGWYPQTLKRLAALPLAERAPVLLWLTEPLPPPACSGLKPSPLSPRDVAKLVLRDSRANDQRTTLGRLLAFRQIVPHGIVAVSTRAKVETLAELGVDVPFVPLGVGFEPRTDGDPERLAVPAVRDIDVLFVGDPAVPHRRKALRSLRRAGVDVIARGGWHPTRGLWGEERDLLLRRTKLLLNISRHPGNAADHRLGMGSFFGAVTVSEPMYRPDPYVAGVHYEQAPLAELPALIHDLLEDDLRRERIAAAAAEVVGEFTLADSARALVDLIEARETTAAS